MVYNSQSVSKSPHYTSYFDAVSENVSKYGEKTVVLMMTGSFYEIYGLKDNTTGEITGTNGFDEIVKITHLNAAEKASNGGYEGKTILQLGFRDYSIDKYLPILNENGWTVAIYEQYEVEGKKNMERKLDRVFSPGTSFYIGQNNHQSITNNIMCVWMKRSFMTTINNSDKCVFGISSLDIYTGKCMIHEYYIKHFKHQTISYDDLERYYTITKPNEIIFIYEDVSEDMISDIIKYLSINVSIRKINLNNQNDILSKNVKKCEKQVYREEITRSFFKFVDYHEFCDSTMLNINEYAHQSLCFLLSFTNEHNENLTKYIKNPIIFTKNDNVILANHSLQQLNIIRDSASSGVLSSVYTFITSKCSTDMGSRELKNNILNPTINENFLNNEYNIINFVNERNKHDNVYTNLRNNILKRTSDIEKIFRKMLLKDAVPSTIKLLYENLSSIANYTKEHLLDNDIDSDLNEYIYNKYDFNINQAYNSIINVVSYIDKNLLISLCNTNSKKIEENIFKTGINKELDKAHIQYKSSMSYFLNIKKVLETMIETQDKKLSSSSNKSLTKKIKNIKTFENNKDGEDFDDINNVISIHQTEKSLMNLKLTARRAKILDEEIKKRKENIIINSYENNDDKIIFDIDAFTFTSASSQSGKYISHPVILQLVTEADFYQKKIITEVNLQFKSFLTELTDIYNNDFERIINYIISLDLATTKSYISTKYNYCCPDIDQTAEKSYIDVKELRHILIEHLQKNEIYVPNDICLGKNTDGILLFGTNSVGKSSLIKSIGISVIMAQSGMFVPASEFKFKPYKMIMTRILGNDNIFKGLSTFIVEMTELKTILNFSNKDTLVLGDEVCSGTESISAISIFSSALIHLHNVKSTFLFATHFHEVSKLEEIKKLNRMTMKHMKVRYNHELDQLEYVRKLCDGVGDTNYGLEVCKSLNMPNEFLDKAYEIRKIINPEIKSLLETNTSKYNSAKIKYKCELCGNIAEEIHHIKEQHKSNENGFIGTFNKNHVANLTSICSKCHDNIHIETNYSSDINTNSINKNKKPIKKIKTTKGYQLSFSQ